MNIYLNANKGMKTKFKTQRKHKMGEQWARDLNSYTTEAHLHICTSGLMELSTASYKLKGLLWFLSAPQNTLPGKECGDADSKSQKRRVHQAAANCKTAHPHIQHTEDQHPGACLECLLLTGKKLGLQFP